MMLTSHLCRALLIFHKRKSKSLLKDQNEVDSEKQSLLRSAGGHPSVVGAPVLQYGNSVSCSVNT